MAQLPDAVPNYPLPFVGRQNDLAAIHELLANPSCRLITLLGPGGIGKTRLAAQITQEAQAHFPDGACFVPLQPISSADLVVMAIAERLGCPLRSDQSSIEQIQHYLQDKTLLLTLDNIEHLPSAVDTLTALLDHAPSLKVLVTSRIVLNLQQEWLYPLHGLDLPPEADLPDQMGSAVQLFVERARRVRSDFAFEAEQATVAQICRLVEGMPLAIELAASWVRTLPCAVIAAEITRNVAFLATNVRDVEVRHRSMRATFDYSWQLLTEEERAAFARLAVFQGSIPRAAAEAVAGANVAMLAALVDASLLRLGQDGRYYMHELLRQYAAMQLSTTPDQGVEAHGAHATYFMRFLAAHAETLAQREQTTAIAAVAADLANIHVAWQHSITKRDVAAIQRSAHGLSLFYEFHGPYQEGVAALTHALAHLRDATPEAINDQAIASILVDLGRLHVRMGHIAEARAALEESEAWHSSLDLPPRPGRGTDPLLWLAVTALVEGNYGQAARYGEAAHRRNEQHHHIQNLSYSWFVRTVAAFRQGVYTTAWRYAHQGYAIAQACQDRWNMASLIRVLGEIAAAEGRYDEAREYYQASYTMYESFGEPDIAVALNQLGTLDLLRGRYDEARAQFEQGLVLSRKVGDRGSAAEALGGLGAVACADHKYPLAARLLAEALRIATDIRAVPLLLTTLMMVSELLLELADLESALEVLVVIVLHPSTDRKTNDRAQQLLLRYETALAPDRFDAVTARSLAASLDTMVARLLTRLRLLERRQQIGDIEQDAAPPAPAYHSRPPTDVETQTLAQEGQLHLDVEARELVVDGERIRLSHLEYTTFYYLLERQGKAVSRMNLLDDVWGYSYDGGSNVVDVVIRSLRKKLGRYASAIETVTKVGYRYRPPHTAGQTA